MSCTAKDFIVEDDGVEQAARLDRKRPRANRSRWWWRFSAVVALTTSSRGCKGLKSMLDPLFSLGTASCTRGVRQSD